jgi:SPP1 gp7 family putative phage head morphogenesis protein
MSTPHTEARRAAIVRDVAARRAVMKSLGVRRRRVPRQLLPNAIQLEYFKTLRAMVRRLHELVMQHVGTKIELWQGSASRHDDLSWEEDYSEEIAQAMEETRREFEAEYPKSEQKRIVEDVAKRTSNHQQEQLRRQMKAALGIDIVHAEPWIAQSISRFTAENVSLIGSIESTALHQVETLLLRDITAGRRHEEISDDIEARFGVSESRASLIARDQCLKFTGELNKRRQADLGMRSFRWATSRDNRVREEHAAREGKIFPWDVGADVEESGRDGSFPGTAGVNCRCTAEPVIEELLSQLDEVLAA